MLRTRCTLHCLLLVLTCGLNGCTFFSKELDKAAQGAGRLVTFYCENVTEPTIREEFRAAVNAHADPHSVNVTCAQGGPPLLSSPPESD